MTEGYLSKRQNEILDEVLKKHGIEEFDAYVEFWNGKKVQIDGHLGLAELRALTEAMERMTEGPPIKKPEDITIPFTKDAIKNYLDGAIRAWRKKRDEHSEDSSMAIYYIDAYQSVRTSIFNELLPQDIVPVEPAGEAPEGPTNG